MDDMQFEDEMKDVADKYGVKCMLFYPSEDNHVVMTSFFCSAKDIEAVLDAAKSISKDINAQAMSDFDEDEDMPYDT